MILIDGKKIAAEIRLEVKQEIDKGAIRGKRVPGLALLLVGKNPASDVYVASKNKACTEVGMYSVIRRTPESTSERNILEIIDEWNNNGNIDGILVQLPLPKHINEQKVITRILPQKDVDGFHPENVGRLMIGMRGFVPCTPAGIVELLKRYDIQTRGRHVVVVGRSNIVGKPVANLLLQKGMSADAVVTVCHSAAADISVYTRQADILIVAAGVAQLIKEESVKDGAVVIDVGMNRIADPAKTSGTRLCGDVDFENVAHKCSAITPVPGGVGPMTIAMLLRNTLLSAKKEVYDE